MTENIKYLIKFKTADVKSNSDLVVNMGGSVVHTYKSINWMAISLPKDRVEELRKNPNIESIEEDHEAHALVVHYIAKESQVEPSLIVPWGVIKIRAPEVHQNGNTGSAKKVGIIDTGIDTNHPNLVGNYKGGYNFVNNTSIPEDDYGHGTHVAGITAAISTGNGLIGAAPSAYLYAIKVLDNTGSGSYSNIIAGIDWCIDNGIQIINMSLGGSSFSQALKDACDAAYANGILLIASAGNSGQGTDTIAYPAKYDSCIAVGATDQNDLRASFSSTGPKLEVCAPGVSIPSSVPTGTCSLCDPSGYKNLSGTSMSAPHVAGTAALIMFAHPDYTNKDVRVALSGTAIDLGTPGRDPLYGYGRIDAKAAVDNNPPPPPEPVLTKITLQPPSISLNIGQTQQVQATAYDQYDDTMASIQMEWSVANSNIGSITPTSTITGPDGIANSIFKALSAGNTTLSVISGSVKSTINVSVTAPSTSKFTVQELHGSGVVVIKNPFGNQDANSACAEACRIIKSL